MTAKSSSSSGKNKATTTQVSEREQLRQEANQKWANQGISKIPDNDNLYTVNSYGERTPNKESAEYLRSLLDDKYAYSNLSNNTIRRIDDAVDAIRDAKGYEIEYQSGRMSASYRREQEGALLRGAMHALEGLDNNGVRYGDMGTALYNDMLDYYGIQYRKK